ncbi:MAG TPA: class III extradiol dioxygenase family protein [Steroidobacteraceae bacterium]|nr:class III extradiol dioxygenase family protein [Steroidobacteraceae bacterium]
MARIIGCLATSHVPLIGRAIARGLQQEPYWRDFFEGYRPIQAWLQAVKPDVAVVFYNDHGLNFFLDAMPTFAVGAAEQYLNADEGWGLPSFGPFRGDPSLSWHLIESLIEAQFDVTSCQQMRVDHAFTIPMALAWPGGSPPPVRTVPIAINTVQHPLPSPARCFLLGQAVGRALEAYSDDARVLIIGSGGLSHQLDGERAGFINRRFDALCLERLVTEPQSLTHYSVRDLIENAGTQGVELLMWLAARGAMHPRVSQVHSHYVVPISNTAAATLVLENAA